MKQIAALSLTVLILLLSLWGCGGGGGGSDTNAPDLNMGLLQFRVQHTLEDDSCLPGDCNLTGEEETDTAAWLDRLSTLSNMAVLHWDRPLPWLTFDADVPAGENRVEYYDEQIDDSLRNWLDAFAVHFQKMPSSYLAISVLDGTRKSLQNYRIDSGGEAAVAGTCPDVSPGTEVSFQYDPGTGPIDATFNLERSYTNFVLYLYDKMQPDNLALMVETNLYKEPCPGQWSGLVQLYQQIYDTVRPQVNPATKVFATLSLQPLLDYDDQICHGPLDYRSCAVSPPPPTSGTPNPITCYPLDLSAITDLDQGDRLEILALSFYPDSLLMARASDNLIKLYPESWDGTSGCTLQAQAPPFLDPLEALDRFNWTKPIAIAELGARSGRSSIFNGGYIVQLPADLSSQSFWLDHFLTAAKERSFAFYVQSFGEDFKPIGPWTVQQEVLDAEGYSIYNTFAYMGIYDDQGRVKPGVTQTWLDYR